MTQHHANFRAGRFPISRRRFVQVAAGLGATTILSRRPNAALPATAQSVTPQSESNDPAPSITLTPQPDTVTAFPHTSISFRGIGAATLGNLTIVGDVSGAHSGVVVDHPDGLGCSFLLDTSFEAGETVSVLAEQPLTDSSDGAYSFRIANPAPSAFGTTDDVTDDPDAGLDRMHAWVTQPTFLAPMLTITETSDAADHGHIFLTSAGPGAQPGAMIVDERGEPVWYTTAAQETSALYCLKLQDYRGQPVLTYAESARVLGYGFGHWVMLDQQYEPITHIRAGNGIPGLDVHDLVLTPQGTAWAIAYAAVHWDLTPVGGAKNGIVLDGVIQEIELETGLVLFEWHSLDHIDVTESVRKVPEKPGQAYDYIHLNSLAFDDDGHILLSARHTHAAYKIHRRTGAVIWRLNGKQSDYAMGQDAEFAFAHDVQRQSDGTISLFDNHSDDQSENGEVASRALFLELDDTAMTATVARAIIHPTDILSVSQANVQVLENGNVFIGWGSAPVFSEHDAEGNLIFNGRFPTAMQSYRAYLHEWQGRPSAPPAVVARRSAGNVVAIDVSWNGATDVDRWRVLGGDSPEHLEEIGLESRSGFETHIDLNSAVEVIQLQAIDTDGNLLGESAIVVL